ncbi:cysteine hydrolase family protein [Nocardia carnea]|uniref:cysteine hydrolase family protein n=1 Tax=Nocardia carnea TaxID=37328 RepID=UPI002455AFB3|nr:cysteine hydrolase family protein [Nocardia carnea]
MPTPRRALIVVDVQQEYFAGPLEIQFPPRAESLANIVGAMDAAHSHGIPVVIVQHESRPGAPAFVKDTPGWALHPAVAERAGTASKHLHKQFSSAFARTDLVEWLRAREIDTVTIVGYMTNNCDLGTAVEAEGHGFTAEILSDATGTVHLANEAGRVSAADLHATLMVLLHSNYAAVGTTAEWIESLRSGTSLTKNNLIASAIAGRTASTPVPSA